MKRYVTNNHGIPLWFQLPHIQHDIYKNHPVTTEYCGDACDSNFFTKMIKRT